MNKLTENLFFLPPHLEDGYSVTDTQLLWLGRRSSEVAISLLQETTQGPCGTIPCPIITLFKYSVESNIILNNCMHVFLAFKTILFYSALENWYFVCVHTLCKMLCTVTQSSHAQGSSLPLDGFGTSATSLGCEVWWGKVWTHQVGNAGFPLSVKTLLVVLQHWKVAGQAVHTVSFPYMLFICLLLYRPSVCVNKWPTLAVQITQQYKEL